LIYETAAAMKVEPDYIYERHKGFRSGNASEEASEETTEAAAEEPKEGDE
jgi:ribosomal protein S24E